MIRTAQFSDCMKYRYTLYRQWSDEPKVMCIGLNPSTANGATDDATINRLCNVLPYHRYGAFYMVNLYALITPHPEVLFSVPDPMGENEKWIYDTAAKCDEIIFCWGNFKGIGYRANQMKKRFPQAWCFGHNADGSPWHPRALHYKGIQSHDVQLIRFKK